MHLKLLSFLAVPVLQLYLLWEAVHLGGNALLHNNFDEVLARELAFVDDRHEMHNHLRLTRCLRLRGRRDRV